MKAIFDPTNAISYGSYRCPICKAEFFSGGKALHEKDCSETGYEKCDYLFGLKESGHFTPRKVKAEVEKILVRRLE